MAAAPLDHRAHFRRPFAHRIVGVLIAFMVGGFYLWCAQVANAAFEWRYDKVEYYDLLGRGLAGGHLYLPVEPSPQLLALPDPLDIRQSGGLGMQDAVLYNRRFYLYHGVTPAILFFTPWRLVTGRDAPEPFAAFLFCLGGYLFAYGTLLRLLAWTHLLPSLPVFAGLSLAIGLSQPAAFLLQRVSVYEVAIAGGYFCVSAGFWFLARGVLAHRISRVALALSGLWFGLAIGSRPHLAAAGVCALGLVVWLLCRKRTLRAALPARETIAFVLPMAACILALAAYNYARFGNPFEFGLRHQMADPSAYAHPSPALQNIAPGLYYFFVSFPSIDPVFPFVRLVLREFSPLPTRYFLEPTAGMLALFPLLLLVPWLFRKLADATARAFAGAVICFGLTCALIVASLGLTSERYEMDFVPSLVLIACFLAALPARGPNAVKRSAMAQIGRYTVFGLLFVGIASGFLLGIQGPYDEFVENHPAAFVKLARLFSPIPRYRPLYNPELAVEVDFEFPDNPGPGPVPLIAAGRLGSRYLLTAEVVDGKRVKLTSATSLRSSPATSAEVANEPGGRNRVRLEYRPSTHTVVVFWNGEPALQHAIPFLVTAPSQVLVGVNRTEQSAAPMRFRGLGTIRTKLIDNVRW